MTEKVCGMTGLKELRDNVRDHTDDNPAGGSDKAVQVIEEMKDDELKKWLTEIVKKDMSLGVKIIVNKED